MTTRLTRAQRAQQTTEDPSPSDEATDPKERAPLNEISLNASPEQVIEPEEDIPNKTPAKSKSKKGAKKTAKKTAKAKKAKAAEDEQIQVVLEDERQAAGSPASDAAVEDLIKTLPEGKSSGIFERTFLTHDLH
jgi:membrane protein involved in colicin uptake